MICFFSIIGLITYSQKKGEVTIKGTVYINSSRSQGIANGQTFTDPQKTFVNQPIYFKKDPITVKTMTDAQGNYTAFLKPGSYEVFQEAGLKSTTPGLAQIGTFWVTVGDDGGTYDIYFKNHVNGRSVAPGAMPGSKSSTPKKVHTVSEK